MISALEPVDRVNPVVNERQPGRRRQGRRFPAIGEPEDESDTSAPADERAPASEPRRDESDGESRIDIVVAGRTLPTRQRVPSGSPSANAH